VLGESPEDPLLLFSVLYEFWNANYVAFNGDVARGLAAEFLAIAEKRRATVLLMVGHRVVGASLLYTGNIAASREHFDQAIALYDPAEHRSLATLFGEDVGVTALIGRSLAFWVLGYPEAARAETDRTLKHSREIGHVATLMRSLYHASLSHAFRGEFVAANALGDELLALADEQRSPAWKPLGMFAQGYVLRLMGKASDAVQVIAAGITAHRSNGTIQTPLALSNLARAHAELGQWDDAWRCLDEAITVSETTGERWYGPEIHRIGGEIAQLMPKPDAAKAEAYFEHALSVARQQQAKSWELRAAMSMARLWRDQGKRDEARDLLAPVYGWFTEGFDTLDLKEAKALLNELAA
jgi:predicted ATPase